MTPTVEIHGGTGRLGQALAARFRQRGDSVFTLGRNCALTMEPINYLVLAQRYRGSEPLGEFGASVERSIRAMHEITWAEDSDCAAVIVSSDCTERVGATKNLGYMLGKAAALHLVPWYARNGSVRINAVSPAAFTGEGVVVDIEDVVEVIAFLCSPASRGINGENITIDRGRRWK